MSQSTVNPSLQVRPSPLSFGELTSALSALFGLSLLQHIRGRRLILMCILFSLPAILALIGRYVPPEPARTDVLQFAMIFTLLPHALLPLAALLHTSGMIRDEIEDQTLTYLLVRPIPRWALYLTKLLATLVLTIALSAIFTAITFWAIYGPELPITQMFKTIALFSLAITAYCTIFGCISLFTSRTLVAGIAYVILFEGVLANVDFVIRQLTVMFYLRVLSLRWIGVEENEWDIDLVTAPSSSTCVLVLLGVSLAAGLLGAYVFGSREFRVKTPEGS